MCLAVNQHTALVGVTILAPPLILGRHFNSSMQGQSTKILSFSLQQEMLLRPKDGAWTDDSDPPDEVGRWELEVLHCVQPNQRTRTAQTCLAVDSYHTTSWLVLCQLDKPFLDSRRGHRTINKEEV